MCKHGVYYWAKLELCLVIRPVHLRVKKLQARLKKNVLLKKEKNTKCLIEVKTEF